MITRNIFGKIEPSINNYFIQKNYHGKYEIMKHEQYYITDAKLFNEFFLWVDIEPFDSMIQAYKFLKENISKLL